MNKFKSLALLVIVCLVFAACSKQGENPDNNQNNQSPVDIPEAVAETTTSHYDILGERDFDGGTFAILDANWNIDIMQNIPDEAGITGEPINDALYNRDKLIEEKYGVNIKYIQIEPWDSGCRALEKSVLAGENIYDMVVSIVLGNCLNSLSTRNVLHNLLDAPHLSLKSPWWSKLVYENIQFNNKLFYMGGDIFLSTYSGAPAAMMFNKKLMRDYNIQDDLYKLVFDGKWTLDVLQRIIKDKDIDLNQDGKMKALDDFYGLVGQWNTVTSGFWLAGLGLKFSTVADNAINVDFTSPFNLERIDKLTNMLEKTDYEDQMHIIERTFKEGRAMFLAHCLITPQLFLRDMEDDYGVLPMPKYDEKQESYVSFMNAWCNGFVGIPQTADMEKSAFLMEAMGYAGYEMLRRPVYDITIKAKGTRDEESERMIDIIIETAYLDINSIYNFGGSCDILRDTVMDKKPFVSAYEKKEAAIQKDIGKFIDAMSGGN